MAAGKVKWFNNAKGYGFILPEGGGEDLFAHYSSIQMDGYKTLKAGQDVEFEVLEGPKGLHAVNISAPDTEGVAAEPAAETPVSQPPPMAETPNPDTSRSELPAQETSDDTSSVSEPPSASEPSSVSETPSVPEPSSAQISNSEPSAETS